MKSLEEFYEFLNEWENENKVMVGIKVKNCLIQNNKLTKPIEKIIDSFIEEPHTTNYGIQSQIQSEPK